MAQRGTRGTYGSTYRSKNLLSRFGLTGRKRILVCACALTTLALVVGVYLMLPHGVVIERSNVGSNPQVNTQVEVENNDNKHSSNHKVSSSSKGKVDENEDSKNGDEAQETSEVNQESSVSTNQKVVIDVDGAVNAPGVYELQLTTPRAQDAINAAGGLTPEADTARINLAAPVADGTKLYVPKEGEEVPVAASTAVTAGASPSSGAGATASSQGAASQAASGQSASAQSGAIGMVNINTATSEEFQTLPGIGEVTAQAIVDDRDSNGPFASIEDLMRVSGIGEKKFEKIRDHVCV